MSIKKLFIKSILSISQKSIFIGKSRIFLLKRIGIKITGSCDIRAGVYFDSNNVKIQDSSLINRNCEFNTGLGNAKIEIGKNVFIGMNTCFICVTHELGDSIQRAGSNIYRDIHVQDGCWIGANCTLLPGILIGEGCVIAAGAVVTKDCESNYLYAGVPARKIKKIK